MKTIFHIGTPKTGTTALQDALHASRAALVEVGVLYPSLEQLGFRNHHPLIVKVKAKEQLPRQFKFRSDAELQRLGERSAAMILDEISGARPDTLILSSEYFYRQFGDDDGKRLAEFLDRLGVGELTFSVYIRRPSAYYLSRVSQNLKFGTKIPAIRPLNLASRVEWFRARFPASAVDVALYEKSLLRDGDIASDFAHRHLTPIGFDLKQLATVPAANTSLSAEGSEIVLSFRSEFLSRLENRMTRSCAQLIETIREIEAEVGAGKPRLRPGLAERIDSSETELLWVRDRYALEFPSLDYKRVGRETALAETWKPDALSDVLEIDRDIELALLDRLRATRWGAGLRRSLWIRKRLRQIDPLYVPRRRGLWPW